MRSDNVLRLDAMNLLRKEFGEIEAERFIYLVKSDHFDYTEWQRTLWEDKTLDEVFELAVKREKERGQKIKK
jgi:hypothetical protein